MILKSIECIDMIICLVVKFRFFLVVVFDVY